MILFLCSVYDVKSGAFAPLRSFRAKGEALRSFMDAVAAEDSGFARHAGDYSFWHVGNMDDNTGKIEPVCEQLITALECVSALQNKGK